MSIEKGIPSFVDPGAEHERGFIGNRFNTPRLPGTTWESGNIFDSGMSVPNCNMEDGVFSDTVWNFGTPDRLRLKDMANNKVFYDIFYSDAVRRLQAVEQLTLPPEYTTIPNTAAFSRFEHIWGSVLFTGQIAIREHISTSDTTVLQLRTLVSDLAHTIGSHLGDWMFQGIGNEENQHDLELASYLEKVGINDILRRNDVDPESVIFPDIKDWVEAPQPDLCVDRVDYGLREMNRWNDTVRMQGFSAEDFTLTPEHMLAMTDQRRARIFSEGYLLLSEEHWSEPTHRFLEDMLILRTKLFYGQGGSPRSWVFERGEKIGLVPLHEIHPRDLMYVTEPTQIEAYALPNLGGHVLESIMMSVARYRRQYVWPGRRERIARYMNQFSDLDDYEQIQRSGHYTSLDSESYNSFLDEYPKTLACGFAILDPETAEQTKNNSSLDILQLPFKTRQIDPLVRTDDKKFKRLSELDPSYAKRLEEHSRKLKQQKIARLAIADPETFNIVESIINNTDYFWQKRLKESRHMTSEELKSLISVAAHEIHGAYPFMSFLEY